MTATFNSNKIVVTIDSESLPIFNPVPNGLIASLLIHPI